MSNQGMTFVPSVLLNIIWSTWTQIFAEFFQKPSKDRKKYDKVYIGKSPLGEMMKTISENAGLSKVYMNHQIRKTTESVQHYIDAPTHEDKETYSNALFEYS